MKITDMPMDRLRAVLNEYKDNKLAALARLDFDGANQLSKKITEVKKELKSRR